MSENFKVVSAGKLENLKEKFFLKEKIGSTGSEISINNFKPGQGYPFIHKHKNNEEIYIVVKGSGIFYADGKEFSVKEGDSICVAPECHRGIAAGSEGMICLCVQAKKDSLDGYTMTDGSLTEEKTSWL